MVFFSYLDDSKDRGAKRIVVSGGLYGSKESWGNLRAAWNQILGDNGLQYYKSSECFSVTGQFEKYREGAPRATPEARRRTRSIRTELQGCLGKHLKLRAVGVAIHAGPYRRLAELTRADRILPEDPYKHALSSVMFETAKCIRQEGRNNVVVFVHDDGDDFPELYKCYLEFREKNPRTAKFLGGFQRQDSEQSPALQVADLLANHATFLAGKAMDRQHATLEMRLSINRLGVWHEPYLRSYLKDWYERHGRVPPTGL